MHPIHDFEETEAEDIAEDIQQADIHDEDIAAEFTGYASYNFLGTEEVVQILPFNAKRKEAEIYCVSGYVNNNIVGYLVISPDRSACQRLNGMSLMGDPVGQMVAGMKFTHKGRQPLYAKPDGTHSLSLIVKEERYA